VPARTAPEPPKWQGNMVRSWVETRRRGMGEDLFSSAETNSSVAVAAAPAPAPAKTEENDTHSAYVSVLKEISGPLLSAVSQVVAGQRENGIAISAIDEANAFNHLIQQVVNITRTTSATLEIGRDATAPNGEPMRRQIIEAVSDLMGAHYRAAAQLQPSSLVGQLTAAITQIAIEGARREDLMPGLGTMTQARLGIDMLRAIPPVVHAVTRFAFGRNALVLITEVAWELQYKAVEVTKRLMGTGATLQAWHSVYGAALHAAAEMYAEAHYAEADQFARYTPEQRQAFIQAMGPELPMTNVWAAFDRQTDFLAQFTATMMSVTDKSGNGTTGWLVGRP